MAERTRTESPLDAGQEQRSERDDWTSWMSLHQDTFDAQLPHDRLEEPAREEQALAG
jgi:hypothetical protein